MGAPPVRVFLTFIY